MGVLRGERKLTIQTVRRSIAPGNRLHIFDHRRANEYVSSLVCTGRSFLMTFHLDLDGEKLHTYLGHHSFHAALDPVLYIYYV